MERSHETLVTVACPICGGGNHIRIKHVLPHVWHQASDSGAYDIRWCDSCEYGFLWPRPASDRLASFYGEQYFTAYGDERVPCDRQGFGARLLAHLAWRLDRSQSILDVIAAGTRVCDIGCGNGDLLAALRGCGHEVVGVEPDEAARRRAGDKGLTVYAGTAEHLPEELLGKRFDVVMLNHTLEHCSSPEEALRSGRDILVPGGILAVTVPNNACTYAERSGTSWFHCDAGRHLNFFTQKSLSLLCRRAGFTVQQAFFEGAIGPFLPDRWRSERQVWDALHLGPNVPRPSSVGQWATFVRTMFAPRERRYEVLGILANPA